jgi:hypothetical protein
MRNLARFAVLVMLIGASCCACLAQSHTIAVVAQPSRAADSGVVSLSYPYSISTEPHFAIFVEFPKADSIRRIALGDSNYFLAEADKTDPHYAIIKQIEAPTTKGKPPVATNMLVYMASGRVVDITLKAGKLADTAYSIEYALPTAQHKVDPVKADPPPISKQELAKKLRDQERSELAEKMIGEVEQTPKSEPGVTAGGLDLRFYSVKRLGLLALVSFDVENTSPDVVDLEDPQINLVTANDNQKDRRKAPAKVEPVEVIQSIVSPKQIAPGARAACLVEFNPPVHDSDQHVVISISNRAMADKPATYRIE